MSETLVRTGPGTEMGNLLRRYWVPVLLSTEIAEPDCPPMRARLMDEKLLAFRDSEGRPALIDEFCSHRGLHFTLAGTRRTAFAALITG
jgi:phenylpropionate dioxygenase-like ring-hydroxylating dioxygenase large terminal subunit